MEIPSYLKDVKMMRMKTKNPSLDRTRGPREEDLEKNMSHIVHQRKRPPSQLASLKKGPNLIKIKPLTPDHDWNKTLPAAHGPIPPWINNFPWKEDTRDLFNELMDTPLDFLAFVMNQLKVITLTLELLVGLTFELMKGSYKERAGAMIQAIDKQLKNRRIMRSLEKFVGGRLYSTHGYGYLKEIVVRRADNDFYKFKEGDFPCLRINNIDDMLLLVVQNRLTNLSGYDVSDFAIALRMFTRSIVIQKRVKDLQLAVKSYQKMINVTKPKTTRPDIKKKHPYTPYQDPQGFIYVDTLGRNRLMCLDELYKFSDGTC
nr:hypothetical protein [Tanacetum cinerariifolium]